MNEATTAPGASRQEVSAIRIELDQLWGMIDEIFASLTPADWQKKHGKDWTFADVPYHLSYFDKGVAARPIELGRNMPAADRLELVTMNQLNGWNAREFAKRPAGQTVEQSIAEMNDVRDTIRRLLDGLTDADLERPAWSFLPIFTGWRPVREALAGVRLHTWSHLSQLRLNLKRSGPIPPESVTHSSVGTYLTVMAGFLDTKEAEKVGKFTAVMEITGPAGGVWTYNVANGGVIVTNQRPEKPDFVMSQSPDSFVKMLNHMENPMVAMLTGQIKVKGFTRMPTFGKLFAEPAPDRRIEPMPGALAVD